MSCHSEIAEALEAFGFRPDIRMVSPLGGGSIADVRRVELDTGVNLVAKVSKESGRLQEESDGLTALASTKTVVVPEVIGVANSVLLMEYLIPTQADSNDWCEFGDRLAALHFVDMGDQFGFDHNNHLGNTPQRNDYHDDWVEFNRVCRFKPLRMMLENRNLAAKGELKKLDGLIMNLSELIPAHPRPSLLHGDLWGGNAIAAQEKGIAVIDPAVSIGDGLADIAMMQLFGGFPQGCFDAYQSAAGVSISEQDVEIRLAVYRLYHVLNHWVLFGRGYAEQSMGILRSLGI